MKDLLKASQELSRSPLTFALEKNKYIAEEFVDSLLGTLRQILDCHVTSMVPVQDHILNLHEGAKSISILLHVKQENFNALPDKMKDHIGVVIIDLGIVICSISVNEIKHGLAKGTDLAISRLVKELQFVMQEVAQTHPPTSSSLRFPMTNELASIDFFLENLQEIATFEAGSIAFPKDQIQRIQEDLVFLRSLLGKTMKQRNQNGKFQALWDRIMEVAYKAELVIDSIVLGDRLECLNTAAGDIKHMKTEALKVSDSIRNDDKAQRVANNYIHFKSQLSTPTLNEVLVGLDEEVKTIADRLTRGSKQLDIVSIVGMAGLGKTTLANTIYHHPSILGHSHIRAWSTISQVYSKHNMLVQILSSIGKGSHDQYLEMNEGDLVVMLFQGLKRNSRILFTSRIENLSLQFKLDSKPHHLCHLSDKECLELIQRKIFGKEDCPPALIKVLMQVANKCNGLPHTVVIFAGILLRIEPDCWQEFADSLNQQGVHRDIEGLKKPLELSYIHLPKYLKPCLLYLSAFREDQDIPVQMLSWLWIYEGFVQKIEGKILEDVAEDYLKDLIGRSLVMGYVNFWQFSKELLLLVHLRYLAISLRYPTSIPSAIDNLSRLHTFLVGCNDVAWLPNTIWNIKALRHLRRTENKTFPSSGFMLPTGDVENSPDLDHLGTLSLAIDCSHGRLQKILKKLPHIRKLKCVHGYYHSYARPYDEDRNGILKLDSLSQIESLQLHCFYHCKFEFPLNLKKFTLSHNKWSWSEISTIEKLPNLEVLKLLKKSFMGEIWEMQEGEMHCFAPELVLTERKRIRRFIQGLNVEI
ncbi:unnamed protein product [Coffea canephora]|uniref:Uncharacterized protein n=1 Tax=Coffea canephora TaxID=49390 RepID=A0A068UJH4_COFCA|nr:unnamed protein product [Coffea canephora]